MGGGIVVDYKKLNSKIQEQAEKTWDAVSIEAWLRSITANGIPKKVLDAKHIISHKQEILDRVQNQAEDCTFLCHV